MKFLGKKETNQYGYTVAAKHNPSVPSNEMLSSKTGILGKKFVHFIPGFGYLEPIILVDPNTDYDLQSAWKETLESILMNMRIFRGAASEKDIVLETIFLRVLKLIPYDPSQTDYIHIKEKVHPKIRQGQIIRIGQYIQGAGTCIQQSLLTGAFGEMAANEGLITGKFEINRSTLITRRGFQQERRSHMWTRHVDEGGVMIIDPAKEFLGRLYFLNSNQNLPWPYWKPNENSISQQLVDI